MHVAGSRSSVTNKGVSDMAQFKARMLWENIRKGDLTAVHSLLESGNINLEERDDSGRTFLMLASERGELNIVRELLEAGVDPNAVDNDGWSALLCAAKEGHLEICIELLEHAADKEHKDTCGWTALMWASYKGRIIVVQELLDRGANPNTKADHNMTSLSWAAGRGHTEIVHMLLNKGAKVNTADKYGTTALIWACRKGYVEIVDALLADGANADASGMNSWTPLLIATKGGHYDVVHALLQHDPNVNAIDKDGLTALALAAKEGYVEIVHDLLAKGAYVNVGDRAGDSILIHSVKGGQVEVVRALLNKYVDVDVQGNEGKTALYWAVEKGYNDIVRLLLASEPDMELCTKDDDTPLLRAVRSRNEECVRMLLEKGAKVSACDKRGDTALHIAIRARSKRITELLLRNPRNSRLLYRQNKAGETPYAMDTYHQRGILQQIYGHRNLNASDAENLLGYEIYSSALADILSDPSLTTPITVGLYAKWGSGKSFLINKLESEMKSFTQQQTEEHFMLTWTVVLLALFCSLVVGEALVLGVGLKVGIGVAVAIFLLQIVFFGGVMVFDQRYNMKVAVGISTVLGRRQRLLMLLLRMLFCNPRRAPGTDKIKKNAISTYSVRFLFSDCTRLTSVGGEKALAAMIATLCQAVENEYGFIVTRLFRVFKPHDGSTRSRFKSLCCVPYFVIVLLVLCCIAAGVALLVQFHIKEYIAVDGVLIGIACILMLTVVGNIYTWAQSVMALVSPQKRRVLRAAEKLDTLKMDGFLQRLKLEVELMSRMVTCMDAFTTDQTRLVVIVDGLDTCEQDKVLQVLDTVKSLFSDENSPFITILAVDPHIIIKGIEQNLRSTFQDTNVNGFDYLRNIVHLPFYLQSQGIRIQNTESMTDTERTIPKLGPQESVISTVSLETKGSGRRRSRHDPLSGSVPQNIYTSSFDLSNTLVRSDYFSDINPRSMRRLMNIVSVTARLLRAYNIEFKWHRLAAWINIIEQWPYRVSWIIYCFEESDCLDTTVTLDTLYKRVLPDIPINKDAEPLLEIDRNERKLEAFLASKTGNFPILNVADLKKFLPCTINLDPYLRKLIRDGKHQAEMQRQEMAANGILPGPQGFPPPPGAPQSTGMSQDAFSVSSHWGRPSASTSYSRTPSAANMRGPNYTGFSVVGGYGAYGPYSHSLSPIGSPFTLSPTSSPRQHPLVFFNTKDVQQLTRWSQFDTEGVCWLLDCLKGVRPESVELYKQRARENNISGLVLQNCEIDEMRPVMEMRFGDWQLFKSAILSLRDWDRSMVDTVDASIDNINSNTPTMSSTFNHLAHAANGAVKGVNMAFTGSSGESGRPRPRVTMQEPRGGPRGRRMRRNDSIVQQISYEAAIINEAVEEFVEDTDGGEDEVEEEEEIDETEGGHINSNTNTNIEDCGVLDIEESEPLLPRNETDEGLLNELITVIEDRPPPGKALLGSPPSQTRFSPFLFQGTQPDGVCQAVVSELQGHCDPMSGHNTQMGHDSPDTDLRVSQGYRSDDSPDSHGKHHHASDLLRSLSSSIEKIARPIIHTLDSYGPHQMHYHKQHDEVDDSEVTQVTIVDDSAATDTAVTVSRGTITPTSHVSSQASSPWDRDISSASPGTDTGPAILPVDVPTSPVRFTIGSGPSSPIHLSHTTSPVLPTLRMENEITDLTGSRSFTVAISPEGSSRAVHGPWQLKSLHQQGSVSLDLPSAASSVKSSEKERESNV